MGVNVRINGVNYPDVPRIDVPKVSGGGNASFYDCSGDDATAEDVAQGKICHGASGLIVGTASGGGGGDRLAPVCFGSLVGASSSPVVISGSGKFYGLNALQYIDITCDSLSDNCLRNVAYKECIVRGVKTVGAYHLAYSTALYSGSAKLTLTDAETIGNYGVYNCAYLANVYLPKCTSIGASAFYSCYRLTDIFLGAETVCTLANVNAFNFTGIAMTGSYAKENARIHVRSELEEAYKAATNWSTFASKIVGDL